MRNWYLAGLCGVLVSAMSSMAFADVDGQTFDVNVSSTYSGNFEGVLSFVAPNFFFDAEDGEGGSGSYTESGGPLTIVTASGDNGDDYMGQFVAISFDPKQLPGLLGASARRNRTPATISGRGYGNVGDTFRFSGTEIAP